MFDKLHVMYIISFIHLISNIIFVYFSIELKTANQIDRIDVNPSAVRQRMTQVYLRFLLYSCPVFKFSFKCEHSKCHTILISLQITLMLKCGVAKLLCITNKIRSKVFEAFYHIVHLKLRTYFTIAKYKNDIFIM